MYLYLDTYHIGILIHKYVYIHIITHIHYTYTHIQHSLLSSLFSTYFSSCYQPINRHYIPPRPASAWAMSTSRSRPPLLQRILSTLRVYYPWRFETKQGARLNGSILGVGGCMVLQRCEKNTQHHRSCWEVIKKREHLQGLEFRVARMIVAGSCKHRKWRSWILFQSGELSWKTGEDIKRAITKPASFETLRS